MFLQPVTGTKSGWNADGLVEIATLFSASRATLFNLSFDPFQSFFAATTGADRNGLEWTPEDIFL
jgi:hypothetical protein